MRSLGDDLSEDTWEMVLEDLHAPVVDEVGLGVCSRLYLPLDKTMSNPIIT